MTLRRPGRLRPIAWLVALPLLAALPASAQTAADPQLASFDRAWQVVYETHFDTTFNGVDWRALREELRPRAVGAPQDTVRVVIRTMLARLNQSHFSLIDRETADDPTGGGGGGTAGLDVRLLDGRIVVTAVDPAGPADRAGIRRGWVLAAVDSNRTDSLLARLGRRASYYSDAMRAASVAGAWLAGVPGTSVTVELLDGADRPVRLALVREADPGAPVKFGDFPVFHARSTARRVGGPPGPRVGVIWFNTWMVPLMRQVDSSVHALRDSDGMVLDLRGNRGGVGAMVMGVAGHFTSRRDTLGLFRSRTASLAFVANPRRTAPDGSPVTPFDGPVAILIDALSGSASEVFAGGMQSVGLARVFGETSMGGVLPAHWERLPNGDVLYHAVADFVTGDGVLLEGRGVIPDEPVAVGRRDLLAGRDPALEAAIRWIASARSARPEGDSR